MTYIPLQNSHSQDKAPAPIWGLTIPPRPDGSLRHGGSSLCHSAPKRDSGSTPQAAQPIQKSGLLQGRGKTGRPLPRRREASAATPRLHRYRFFFCLHRRRRLDWSYSFHPKGRRPLPQRGRASVPRRLEGIVIFVGASETRLRICKRWKEKWGVVHPPQEKHNLQKRGLFFLKRLMIEGRVALHPMSLGSGSPQ